MQRSFTAFSIVVHAVVISAVLIAQVPPSARPTLRQAVLFDASQIMPVDIQPPAPRRAVPAEAASR
jgi:hypothetical protein